MPNSKASVLHGEIKDILRETLYPVGSIYISLNDTNPHDLFGGTWELIQDNTFIASKGLKNVGQIGGSNNAVPISHTHNVVEDGEHFHAVIGSNGNTDGIEGLLRDGTIGNVAHGLGGPENDGGTKGYATHLKTIAGGQQIIQSAGKHGHTVNSSGEPGTNKNMPQYLACYIWKRVA